ncbi:MAG: hypothetical protein II934_00735 [Prevotella sp.]|nr:hypothetical protein [Prevotella sp.]
MKRFYLSIFVALAFSFFLSSCNDVEDKDEAFFYHFDTFVKFESPVGTNAVDSLSLVKLEEHEILSYKPYDSQNDEVVLARCVRESDGFVIEIDKYNSYWWWFAENKELPIAVSGQGTFLSLRWLDPNIFVPENAPKEEYDEAYTVYLKSPKIFGDDEERTIKWYVHVRRNKYNTYKCEVNGEEYNFTSRYFGDKVPQTTWLEASGFIIPIPVNP